MGLQTAETLYLTLKLHRYSEKKNVDRFLGWQFGISEKADRQQTGREV